MTARPNSDPGYMDDPSAVGRARAFLKWRNRLLTCSPDGKVFLTEDNGRWRFYPRHQLRCEIRASDITGQVSPKSVSAMIEALSEMTAFSDFIPFCDWSNAL